MIDRAIQRRLVDETIERYVDWREECGAVEETYDSWSRGSKAEASLAFAAYGAALDREERAAAIYAGALDDLARFSAWRALAA